MISGRRILVLAPHTDDGELGAGASISKWIGQGRDVFYVAVSGCETVVPDGLHPRTLIDELAAATSTLGIPQSHVTVLDQDTRNFWSRRQDVLDSLLSLRRDIKPDVVLIPSRDDIHQDHGVVALEGMRAFKSSTVFAYELPWNNFNFSTTAFSIVSESDANRKVEALACYKSQAGRAYMSAGFIRSQLMMRGVQIGHAFAEVFEAQRLIL